MCVVGGGRQSKHSPQGASLLSLSNGLKSSFNEYRVKLNGKSIMAIKSTEASEEGGLSCERADCDGAGQCGSSLFLGVLAGRLCVRPD